jgi:hypothetical protein
VATLLDKLVSLTEKLSGNDDDRGGTITDLLILEIREFHEDLGGGVGNVKVLKDSSTIVSDGHITKIINKHLISTTRAER